MSSEDSSAGYSLLRDTDGEGEGGGSPRPQPPRQYGAVANSALPARAASASPAAWRVPRELPPDEQWQFPGYGQTERLAVETPQVVYTGGLASPAPGAGGGGALPSYPPGELPPGYDPASEEHKLGQWTATSICGNDILSSCLYTVGLVSVAAGVYAPVAMCFVIVLLYLYRSIYSEICTALPLNGGAYNALLHTTRKSTASVAAALTMLSYVATAVTSASDACSYLANVWEGLDTTAATIALLGLFALLSLLGISESAAVATVMFVFHTLTLVMLCVACTVNLFDTGWDVLSHNYNHPVQPNVAKALLYGFSAASLGITGFETSSNFIEEQREGVFVKTLRNMWVAVAVFNPILSFLAVATLRIDREIDGHEETALSHMARRSAGKWLSDWVSVDAFVVLSGAVLTAYVGVVGLTKRLAGDRCLPASLLRENAWRGTNHYIILGFFGVCTSLFLIVNGELETLAGVYSIAFLCVMALFAVGDGLLKYKRNSLPRDVRATWPGIFTGLGLVLLSLVVTIVRHPEYVRYFAIYFAIAGVLFAITFYRVRVFKIILFSVRSCFRGSRWLAPLERTVTGWVRAIRDPCVVFFSRTVRLSVLNKAILYVRENEHTHWVRIVHVCASEESVPPAFVRHVEILDYMYPKMKIDAVIMTGEFGPSAIDTVQRKFGIPKNLMFITCPSKNFRHRMSSLGGVRVITHWSDGDVARPDASAAPRRRRGRRRRREQVRADDGKDDAEADADGSNSDTLLS